MPHPTFRSLTLGALLATAVLPGAASAKQLAAPACPVQPTTQSFASFGDLADYALAPGGSFESGAAGWTFTNAGVVAGNETLGLVPGTSSLKLGLSANGGAATATSPEFCVNADNPSFRFVSQTARAAKLGVSYSYRRASDAPDKVRAESTSTLLSAGPLWSPSAITPLATLLTSGNAQEAKYVRITFQLSAADVKAGGASVDDVLVDPYRRS
ncbi:MAG: hypothetical protein AAGC46_01115 [Solirubrobacteraceae bacterium]